MSESPRPPRLATRLLSAALPRTGHADALLGDLHEEFLRRARGSVWRARRWYFRQAAAIAFRYRLLSVTSGWHRTASADRRSRRWEDVLGALLFDVRYASRRLTRDWRFTIPAVLVLALGIGANTAMFSVVNRALFQRLPFRDADRLVNLYQNQGRAAEPVGSSFPAYRDMARYTDIFSAIAAFTWPMPARYQDDGGIVSGLIEYATSNYPVVHGLSPALGRWFAPDEDRTGTDAVAVLNYHTWVSRFDRDPSVVGTSVRIDGVPVTVIGIGPEGYNSSLHPGLVTDFWLPVSAAMTVGASHGLTGNRKSNDFMVRARLRDGVSLSQAQSAMTALGAILAREYPEDDPGRGISVLPTNDVLIHPQLDVMVDAGASFLMIVVAMLLAIVCSNLATWLLVRGIARGREVSVRLALGASRSRVVRHLIVESTLLAGVGGGIGCVLAEWAMRIVATFDLPVDVGGGLDCRVLVFTLALSLLTGVAFGLAPALGATRGKLARAMRGDGENRSSRNRRFGLKHALVVSQVVLSCVLLGVEGAYVRALRATQAADLGFDVERLTFIETAAAFAGYDANETTALQERLQQHIGALPGVESATLTVGPPTSWDGAGVPIVDGAPPVEGESSQVPWIWAGPGYFTVLGVPLLRGRTFDDADRFDTPRVAVINQSLARRYFGTSDPVGQRLSIAEGAGPQDGGVAATDFEVIGVVPDMRTSLLDPPGPLMYRSWRQGPAIPSTILVRTRADPASLLRPMRQAVRELDDVVPIVTATTLSEQVARELGTARTLVSLLGALGVLGLGLASLGLFAVVSFAVSHRSREIAIRTALGARRAGIIWALSKDVATQMAIGLTVGLALAWLAVRSLGTLVSGLGRAEGVNLNTAPAPDAMALSLVALVMAAVAFAAMFLPAWRATGSAPNAVLREP
jgi:putative ABC transport system permease protein